MTCYDYPNDGRKMGKTVGLMVADVSFLGHLRVASKKQTLDDREVLEGATVVSQKWDPKMAG